MKKSGGMNTTSDAAMDDIHIIDVTVGGYLVWLDDNSVCVWPQFKHK